MSGDTQQQRSRARASGICQTTCDEAGPARLRHGRSDWLCSSGQHPGIDVVDPESVAKKKKVSRRLENISNLVERSQQVFFVNSLVSVPIHSCPMQDPNLAELQVGDFA